MIRIKCRQVEDICARVAVRCRYQLSITLEASSRDRFEVCVRHQLF